MLVVVGVEHILLQEQLVESVVMVVEETVVLTLAQLLLQEPQIQVVAVVVMVE
jgi:hypothetical protein